MRELLLAGVLGVLPFSKSMSATQEAGERPLPIKVEPKAITLEAVDLVKSTDAASQQKARALLTDEKFLQRLNTEREYLVFPAESLQLWFILDALSTNAAPDAIETLNTIAGNPLYRDSGPRQTVLLKISEKVQKPPANIERLWKEQIRPNADELNLAVETLVANGSLEAIRIFEQELLRNEHEPDYLVAWFQDPILRHRQDPVLLEACERLLRAGKWSEDLKRALVEALFDYHPDAWYLKENEPPKPPSRSKLSEPARQKLLAIADFALQNGWIGNGRHDQIQTELKGK